MLDETTKGRTYRLPQPVTVSQTTLDDLAAALGYSVPAMTAPPTYPFVLVEPAFAVLFADPELALSLSHIIHVDQAFSYVRPLVVGDEVQVTLTIDKVRTRGEAEFITVVGELADATGAVVGTLATTLLHRREVAR